MPSQNQELAKRVTKLEQNQDKIFNALDQIAQNLNQNVSGHKLFLEFCEGVDKALTELENKLEQHQ